MEVPNLMGDTLVSRLNARVSGGRKIRKFFNSYMHPVRMYASVLVIVHDTSID